MLSIGLLLCFVAKGQYPQHVWSLPFGSVNTENVYSITENLDRNILYGGSINEVVDLDPGPATMTVGSAGIPNDFVCMTDGTGKPIWGESLSEFVISIPVQGHIV
jgi:hypothetical protein